VTAVRTLPAAVVRGAAFVVLLALWQALAAMVNDPLLPSPLATSSASVDGHHAARVDAMLGSIVRRDCGCAGAASSGTALASTSSGCRCSMCPVS